MEETGALTWERLRTLPTTYQFCKDMASRSLLGPHQAQSACPRPVGVTAQRCAVAHATPPHPAAPSEPMARLPLSLAPSFQGPMPGLLCPRAIGSQPNTSGSLGLTVVTHSMGDSAGHLTPLFARHFPMHARPALRVQNVNIFHSQCRLAPRPFGELPPTHARLRLTPWVAPDASDAAPSGPRRVIGRGAVGRCRPEDAGLRPTLSARGRSREKGEKHDE
jgi:hypothetical protein